MAEFDPLRERHHFEVWLYEMEARLEQFFQGPVEAIAGELNYSVRSLEVLEEWILERYGDGRELLRPEEAMVLDGLSRYVGETLRRESGGEWTISLEDSERGYFGIPIIGETAVPIAPLSLVAAAAQRREGRFLREVVDKIGRWSRGERAGK